MSVYSAMPRRILTTLPLLAPRGSDGVTFVTESLAVPFLQLQLRMFGHLLNVMRLRRRSHDPACRAILTLRMPAQKPAPKPLPTPVISTARCAASIGVEFPRSHRLQIPMRFAILRTDNHSSTTWSSTRMAASLRHLGRHSLMPQRKLGLAPRLQTSELNLIAIHVAVIPSQQLHRSGFILAGVQISEQRRRR